MILDFRIDWGYQYLYSRRHYHPFFRWDGHLECQGGRILECRQLSYPVIWFGPGHCPQETPLPTPSWTSVTRRGMAGIRVLAELPEGEASAVGFRLVTASGEFSFTASEVLEEGRLVFPVGPKYLGCHVIVTRRGHLWFRPAPQPGEQVWEARELPLPCHDWARMETAWLAPGESFSLPVTIPEKTTDFQENLLHIQAMAAPAYTPGQERQIHETYTLELQCDGAPVASLTHYFREHDNFMQLLEDLWVTFPAEPGAHTLTLRNQNPEHPLLFSRLTLRQQRRNHLQFSLPAWGLAEEPLQGRLFATHPCTETIRWPGGETTLALQPGWNEFPFQIREPQTNVRFTAGTSQEILPAIYATKEEAIPVTVGYDMTVVPHDDNGFMDWLLDYTWRTRLGNLVVFRNFRWRGPTGYDSLDVPDTLLERWGRFCQAHGIHVEAANQFESGALIRGAGKAFHSAGYHEYPGAVYARDPKAPWASQDMKEASEHYVQYLRLAVEKIRQASPRTAFGDAAGGHRYDYLAGIDFIRTETMVPHTQHLCSLARAAAETLGSGEWGVHIAIQHAVQPYFLTHLGQYFLSLFQPWMMGASMIYEEDSLFLLFKEERQCWDDALTKGKREMTRQFFRFVKTHPRQGKNRRSIAFWEGRYAAPFNGFICDTEQTPDYSVWGLFGNDAPEWGHRQPEKCRQLLDVLMPGASTHPLRQQYGKRRFFFSGTPYGDFDQLPAEAEASALQRYRLLLNLGWNTMIPQDYQKLKDFVQKGGTLFTGLPQFSTHLRREFLRDMEDLALWNQGDLSELCGVKVQGPGMEYSGQWNAPGREEFPQPELSSAPSSHPQEDGPCRLACLELHGAQVVAWDASTNAPLVLKHRLGKGTVYLLAAWAYPGHEALQSLAASWIAFLAQRNLPEEYVVDPSREVFWTRWEEEAGARSLMLLNTDWTSTGNEKQVEIHTPALHFSLSVKEQTPHILTILPFAVLEATPELHLEVESLEPHQATLKIHGLAGTVTLHSPKVPGKIKRFSLPQDGTILRTWTLEDTEAPMGPTR